MNLTRKNTKNEQLTMTTPEAKPKASNDTILVTVEISQQTSDAGPPTSRTFGGSRRTAGNGERKSLLRCCWPLPQHMATIIGLALIVFVIQFGNSLSNVPSVRLLEDIICQEHYDIHSGAGEIDEALCKGEEVQGELNVVTTGQSIAGFIPGIIVALLFGSLADRWGRKPILAMCVAGLIVSSLVFIAIAWSWQGGTIRTIWASAVPMFIGGGQSVAEAMVFAIVSDLSTEKNRATYFQIVISAVMLAETLAPLIAKPLMDRSLWLPIFLSPGIATFGALFIYFIPETLHLHKEKELKEEKTSVSNGDIVAEPVTLAMKLRSLLKSLGRCFDILRRPRVPLIFPAAALAIPITTMAINIALRYMPLRYGITISTAGIVIGLRTLLSIIVLLIILPLVSFLLNRQYHVPAHRDLRIAHGSAIFLVSGLIVTAAAPEAILATVGLVIFTLGSGVPSLTRAVLADLVAGDELGHLFGTLAMFEVLGYLVSALGLGAVFQAGIAMGVGDGANQSWLGLPFFVAAAAMLAVSVALWCVRSVGKGEDSQGLGREEAASGPPEPSTSS